MSDVTPNYRLEMHRVASQMLEQQASIARSRVDILELADRISRNQNNIDASLAGMESTKKEMSTAKSPIEVQRKKSQIAMLNANVERQKLENFEMQFQQSECYERWKAAEEALEGFTSTLKSLESAHGEFAPASLEEFVQDSPSENDK